MAMTCEAVRPVRAISSSTADGAVVELAQERALLVGEGELGGVADRRSRRARCGPRGRAGRALRGCRRPSRRAGRRRGSGGGSPGWPGCRPGRGRRRPRGSAPSRGAAVESEPLRGAASTTTTPRQRPEMIRLRCGKRPASGPWRIGISLRSAPCAATSRGELVVLGRVDLGQAVGEDGDRPAARLRAPRGGRRRRSRGPGPRRP